MISSLFSNPSRDQVVALAGIFNACGLVDKYARLGVADATDLETAIYSLLQQNPANTEAVFNGLPALHNGFSLMDELLSSSPKSENVMVLRYAVGVIYIAKKICKNSAMMKDIGSGIDRVTRQVDHFSLTHTNVISNVADLYQNTISTLKYRIQVNGVADHLQQPAIAAKIRCALFSGVRSAILWQQVGGNRLQLMLHRKKILAVTRELKKLSYH